MDYKDIHDHALRGFLFSIRAAAADVIARLNKSELIDAAQRTGYTAEYIADREANLAKEWRAIGSVSTNSVSTPSTLTANQTEIIAQSILERSVLPLETKLDNLRLDSSNAIIDINNNLSNVNDNIKDVNSRLDSAVSKLSADIRAAVPTVDASAAVADAVAKAFAPFKAIVDSVAGAPEALAEATAVRIIEQRPAVDVFGIDVRGANGEPLLFHIYNDPDAPKVDPDYIWEETFIRVLYTVQNASINPNTAIHPNVWLAGDKGTGKTQAAEQFAALTGRGFTRFNFHRHTEAADYAGGTGLTDGNTGFVDGPILAGIKRVGHIVLADEVGFVHAGNASLLQGIAEKWSVVNIGGIVHRRASGTIIFAADNTTGNRDETGRFKGTQEQNPALLDRFNSTVIFKFLPASVESNLIQKRVGCSAELADNIVKVLNVARRETESGEIIDAPSLRQAFSLATFIHEGLPVQTAWEITVANKSPAESRAALDAIAASFLSSF